MIAGKGSFSVVGGIELEMEDSSFVFVLAAMFGSSLEERAGSLLEIGCENRFLMEGLGDLSEIAVDFLNSGINVGRARLIRVFNLDCSFSNCWSLTY